MTWSEFMLQNCGYQTKTTFWQDFSIAELGGVEKIRETYKRSFDEWKSNVEYLTELVLVLNHKIWYWYKTKPEFGYVYNELWTEADEWCGENLKGDDASYYFRTTD